MTSEINFNTIIARLQVIKETPDPGLHTEEVKHYLASLPLFFLSTKDQTKATNLIGRTTPFTEKEAGLARNLFRRSRLTAFFLELRPGADLNPALKFLKKTTASHINMEGIIKFLHIGPEVDLNTLLTQVAPLIPFCLNCKQLCHVINRIALFPSGERAEICSLAEPLLQGIDLSKLEKNDLLQSEIITPLSYILQAERKAFCKWVLPFIKDEPSLSRRIDQLTAAAFKAPKSSSHLLYELEGIDHPDLSAMPFSEKEALCTAIKAAELEPHQKTWACQIISYFAPEDRSTVLHSFKEFPLLKNPFSLVKHLLTNPVLRENTHAFLKARLTTEPSEEAAENLAGVLIAKCESFHISPETPPWKKILRGPLARIAATLLEIPLEERSLFCEEARYLWPHAPYNHYAKNFSNLRQLLQLLPVEQRTTHLSLPFLLSLVSYRARFERWAPVITTTPLLFAENDRPAILKIISHMVVRAPESLPLIQAILEDHPSLALSIPTRFIEKLTTETDPAQAGLLAHFILIHIPYFSPFAERELLTYIAIRTMIAAANNTEDPKNPYVIFTKLVDSKKHPTPPAPYHNGVRLQFKKIFETARTTVPQAEVLSKTYGEPLNAVVLENLIQALRDRVGISPHQEAIEEYVKTSTNSSLTALLYNLENPFFTELLSKPYQEEVPLKQAMMCSLTQFFLDLSNEVPEGALLSPREDALCKISASIQNCPQGKAEGLSLTYALLEEKYRYSAESDIDVIKKATAFVRESLQKSITDQLSSNSTMMRALVGREDPESQLAHQSIYLKNLLGPHIGMPHPLQLDPHTGTLETSLVRRSLQTLLDIFYAHFDVETAKTCLQKAFNHLPEESKPKIFNGIIELLGTTEDLFKLDEVTYKPSLTAKGALELLLALGIGEAAPT